jgi:hypothetical protein
MTEYFAKHKGRSNDITEDSKVAVAGKWCALMSVIRYREVTMAAQT